MLLYEPWYEIAESDGGEGDDAKVECVQVGPLQFQPAEHPGGQDEAAHYYEHLKEHLEWVCLYFGKVHDIEG